MQAEALAELSEALPGAVSTSQEDLAMYSRDQGPVVETVSPVAVVRPRSVVEVQAVLRWATAHRVSIVTRGAGSGLSGGANATPGSVILSLERLNRINSVDPDDETAVVEPGVVNADLNAAVAEYGLMYAPDPASYRWSTIGGNVATNAGGLRCAKYGVTRDSVLALEVVLADGTLITTGHRTFKGVAGYDLTALMTGSEGTLGVVVGITVRLRYLPRDIRTLAAYFDDFPQAAAGVLAIGRARVQPAILELLDGRTLEALDDAHGSDLRSRGGSLLLVQTDGFGAAAEARAIRDVLVGLGAQVSDEGSEEADRLVDLRRHSRGDAVEDVYRVGEDVAVPKSQLVHYVAALERMAARHGVHLKVVAHAGDGNLHPTFWVQRSDGPQAEERLEQALDESVRSALALGGTITGEHGVGQYKRRWLGWEQAVEVLDLQRRIKQVFDPLDILNPGKAIVS
ncbi:FAD-linked oxidase C-terminal domain-containing protein [Arthrobacter agilis]|uniref:FAD-binding oxidoreductase n=1 Tax=Arthrobacter agilis TaxID=37921 RepID=UPI002366F96B|nr:FAD-linked oxidase C-terminal domain-containing protein [Arthrobacter agilis]WDF33806.1 FAD-linked oxidase C-terminal domain-containing protein [Arthrobacter agilis]